MINHGKDIKTAFDRGNYCSECGHECGESGDNFCGNCGADMRGGKNETN